MPEKSCPLFIFPQFRNLAIAADGAFSATLCCLSFVAMVMTVAAASPILAYPPRFERVEKPPRSQMVSGVIKEVDAEERVVTVTVMGVASREQPKDMQFKIDDTTKITILGGTKTALNHIYAFNVELIEGTKVEITTAHNDTVAMEVYIRNKPRGRPYLGLGQRQPRVPDNQLDRQQRLPNSLGNQVKIGEDTKTTTTESAHSRGAKTGQHDGQSAGEADGYRTALKEAKTRSYNETLSRLYSTGQYSRPAVLELTVVFGFFLLGYALQYAVLYVLRAAGFLSDVDWIVLGAEAMERLQKACQINTKSS